MTAEVRMLHGGAVVASEGDPDPNVVEEIEFLLEAAKSGRISGIAYAVNFSDDSTNNRYIGCISRALVGALFALMQRASREIDA